MKSELGVLWWHGVGAKNIPSLFPQKSLFERPWILASRCNLIWHGKVRFCRVCIGKRAVELAGRQPCTGLPNFPEGSCDVGKTSGYDAVLVKSRIGFPQRSSSACFMGVGPVQAPEVWHFEGSHARFNVLLSLSGNS